MITNISIAADPAAAGQYQVNYTSTLAGARSIYVNFGASSAYGQQAYGSSTGTNADGTMNCNVALLPGLASFHFQCAVADGSGTVESSADQSYGVPVAVGGGDDDGDKGHGHGDDDHGRGGDDHGRGGDDHGRGGDDHGRGGDRDGGRGRG